ncbi:MAG: 50S ribosomal protein L2 [archaeon]
MGKRIIQQARGHGSFTYRVRRKAYKFRLSYPSCSGIGRVVKLLNSPAHTAPLAKIRVGKEMFYNIAVKELVEGQEIMICTQRQGNELVAGDIMNLADIPTGTEICNIEIMPFGGGKLVRTSGTSAKILKKAEGAVIVLMPSSQEKKFNNKARATVGTVAGAGRLDKPIVKAGKKWHMMKARNKLWPRTSAIKMNVVDHPFGSGRGKRIKSKIAQRNAPPGRKVGLLRPSRTGRRKK